MKLFQIWQNFGLSQISAGFVKKAGFRPEPNSCTALVFILASMAHQQLEEYNSLLQHKPQTGATKRLKLVNKYLLIATFERGENDLIQNFE